MLVAEKGEGKMWIGEASWTSVFDAGMMCMLKILFKTGSKVNKSLFCRILLAEWVSELVYVAVMHAK